MHCSGTLRTKQSAFTMIEMLIVLAVIALLVTLALPRYFQSLERSKDAALLENLKVTREVIDKFFGDQGRYPDSLGELVEKKYLRGIPIDPILGNNRNWIIIAPEAPYKGQVFDIKSAAKGSTREGRAYGSL